MFSQSAPQSARLIFECKSRFSTSSAYSNVARSFSVNRPAQLLRKSSVPFRDYDAVRRNAKGAVSREDVALDAFFSRHRPIFLMDLNGEGSSRMGANRTPWFQSAGGKDLDPEMRNVPEDVVDRLRPFQEQQAGVPEDEHVELSGLAQQLEKTLNLKIKDMEILMPGGTLTINNNDMEATSVMRKRRIKMNRHKYKKRRKVQEAMRRKLNK